MKKRSVQSKKQKNYILKSVGYSLIGVFVLFILFIGSINIGLWGEIPSKKELSNFQYQMASEVYTADSVLIGKYYLYDRQPVSFQDFPEHLKQALISIEDERFYEHQGIDFKSLLRVGFKTLLMGDNSSGGGSTISQQLAKNLYPRKERNKTNIVVDKVKEMIIAKRLEKIFTKDEILTNYLNTVSFGDNTFGIESAALKFYNLRTKDISTTQAATLVGMLKATYSYNPRLFPEKSLSRRNLVLKAMNGNNLISEEQLAHFSQEDLNLDYREFDYNAGIAPYFREEVRKEMLGWIAEQNKAGIDYNIYTSGLKIYTTLNYKMQKIAEDAMIKHMTKLQNDFEKSYGKNAPWLKDKKLIQKIATRTSVYKSFKKMGMTHDQIIDSLSKDTRKRKFIDWQGEKEVTATTLDSIQHYTKFLNTGSLTVNPNNGDILVWIGGINFKQYKYDHISQSKRQVGSTFKPIVYTAALEQGVTPCTYFSAEEVEYDNLKGWSPSNAGNKDEAYLNYSMEEGLSNSVNTIAVKVLEKAGIANVLTMAKDMGISEKLPDEASIALGTGEIKIVEMAEAYTSFSNNGKHIKPILIKSISNNKDSVLTKFKSELSGKAAFSKETGQIMIEMMKSTVNSGTASRLRSTYGLKNEIAGKTGTTQNNKDAWFVALTPNFVHLTWVGLDQHEIGFSNTSIGQGANAALPLFGLWLQELNQNKKFDKYTKTSFPKPSPSVLEALNCDPIKRDGFFKRLFKNPNKKKTKKFNG
ncbi:transglycosylase domain-containing protein [Maribacter hydrothermalis]|uniref:Penicillin-binding protein n=1 Tax=Maribacter hydrothermalis TaxID=1836467 RepID=A0A1B7Z751_9FLAO|nr:transglycosylase domain-containing protein [Maribacter hydrothermalis]APQ16404.1 penicillin-binding protein [Maribacter hydrothermalis]OBR38506.1 penicillin-binding protein [Maribacter hydrothermalis]